MNFLYKTLLILTALAHYNSLQALKFSQIFEIFHKKIPKIDRVAQIGVIQLPENIDGAEAQKFITKTKFSVRKFDGILLLIDSGGGNSGASELIFREIKNIASHKPLVALIIDQCCSGAYKIATAADWIIAPAAA